MGWVDIHTHILPGVDDGPRDMKDSLEMARIAAADGADIMVATPHQRDIMLGSSIGRIRDLVTEMNGRLRAEEAPGNPVPKIVLGMENHIEPGLPNWIEDGRALALGETRFILTEPPFTSYPPYVDQILRRIMDMRLVPVIAHPERNAVLQQHPRRVRGMVEDGMLVQVTGGSFLGHFGRAAQRAAEQLLRMGAVHFIASDTHRPVETRTPELTPAFDRVAELIGEEAALSFFDENPRQLLEGREPNHDLGRAFAAQSALGEPRRWWRFWRRAG